MFNDPINPNHYKTGGVECIELTEMFSFTVGNAVKYLWRAGRKGDLLQDLKKARWYLRRAENNGDITALFRYNNKNMYLARTKFAKVKPGEIDDFCHRILGLLFAGRVNDATLELDGFISRLESTA